MNVKQHKRRTTERRSLLTEPSLYIEILEKMPIFKGLSVNQFTRILSICSQETLSENDIICVEGEESHRMFILLKGVLKIMFSDGKELTRILPLGLVGEMGIFTGDRRSASVVAGSDSIVLSIHKTELFRLFRNDSDLGIHVLTNVIHEMTHKLKKNNILIEELRHICAPGEYTMIVAKSLSVSVN